MSVHMMFKRHKIFASGVHRKGELSHAVWPAERVKGVFEASRAYSPALIPYTFRHPENALPVFGYAERESLELAEEGGRTYLTVVPKEMATEFLVGLKQVGFDRVSIGLGRMGEIVHIGFTDNPAVAGLGAAFEVSALLSVPPVSIEEVEFEGDELGLKSAFEVSWKWRLQGWMAEVASIFQRMRDREIAAGGIEEADRFLPASVMDALRLSLPEEDASLEESRSVPGAKLPATEAAHAELERLQVENRRLMEQADAERRRRGDEVVARFCAEHADVVTPKVKPLVVAILAALQGIEGKVSFEAQGRQVERSAFDAFCDLIAGARPAVVFEAVATKGVAPGGDAAMPGVDPVQAELATQFESARANE
jgi:hypothetical protein